MIKIFLIAYSLLFLSGYIVEPGDILQVVIAGVWGLCLVTCLVNRYYVEAKRDRSYKIVLLVIALFVSLVAPVLVRDASIISWNIYELNTFAEHIFVNLIIVLIIGVSLSLLFLPIVIIYSHLFYSKTKKEDRFFSIFILVAITYFLVSYVYYAMNI